MRIYSSINLCLLLLSFAAGAIMTSCGLRELLRDEKRDFYDYTNVSDMVRLPLIAPRDIVSADRGFTWGMPLWYSKLHDQQATGFDSVGVRGACMAVYFQSHYTGSEMAEVWIVADTLRRDERMFTDRKSYTAYLDSGTGGGLILYDPKALYKDFAENGALPEEWPRHKRPHWAK